MRVEAELPAAPQHGRSAPSWGEPSLPIKGPLNDILAQRLVKDVQNRMEKIVSEPKKSKNISVPEQDIPPVDDLSYSLVKLYFKVNTTSRDDEEDDDYDPYLLQRDYFPELLWAFSMTYMGTHFPNKAEDLPEGVKPAQHYLAYSPTEGILLCVGYYFKNSILQRSSAEYFKDCLQKIVDNIDGQFLDGWGESGFQFRHKDNYICAYFESKLRYVITDVFNVDSLHVRWDSIEEIDNLDWMLSYKAYEWLYQQRRYMDQSQAQLDYLTRHKGNFFFA